MRRVVITQAAAVRSSLDVSDKTLKNYLKQTYGQETRRLSRLSLLALAGALPLCRGADARLSVHAAIHFSSPALFTQMVNNVFERSVAKPLDFLAQLHHAPAFHVAAAAGAQGETVCQAIDACGPDWLNPLATAVCALQSDEPQEILLGWCYEAVAQYGAPQEGSVWVRLSNHPDAAGVEITLSGSLNTALQLGGYAEHYLNQACAMLNDLLDGRAVTLGTWQCTGRLPEFVCTDLGALGAAP